MGYGTLRIGRREGIVGGPYKQETGGGVGGLGGLEGGGCGGREVGGAL